MIRKKIELSELISAAFEHLCVLEMYGLENAVFCKHCGLWAV